MTYSPFFLTHFRKIFFISLLSFILTPFSVTSGLFPVTPVKTGAQGNRQDLASGKAVTPAMHRALPWIPASAGKTGWGWAPASAGVTIGAQG